MRGYLTLLAYISTLVLNAQEVEVGLFWSREPKSEKVHGQKPLLMRTPDTILSVPASHSVSIYSRDTGVEVRYGSFSSLVSWVEFEPLEGGWFKLDHDRTKYPRSYLGRLEVRSDEGRLVNVNHIDLEDYLRGVVLAEGGGRKHPTYYEVQAIISRTYAIRHRDRHASEGFDLCDKVHCQAFHHLNTKSEVIDSAVFRTQGWILVDSLATPISTFFSANCGGQTSRAEWVWNKPVPYCNSLRDTFCIHTHQSQWTKTIALERWTYKLKTKYMLTDSQARTTANFTPAGRTLFLGDPVLGIPLKEIRILFGLKSTWFSTRISGENVVLTGHGFGHGVGVCQEGAMHMAKLGFSSRQILDFYYQGVRMVHLNALANQIVDEQFDLR